VSSAPDNLAADLTRSMADGNASAIESFYRGYFDFLYAQARRLTGRDEAFCLDVVQDSVLRVIRTVRPVATQRQLLGWLSLVVRTTAYDLLKSERRRLVRQTAAIPAGAIGQADSPIWDEEQLASLRHQISRLDPQLAKMIELRYTRQWTLSRIGLLLGLSVGSVDGRLRRAISTLRRNLEELDLES
jgi:RNA polymerase sigma factor (sigma-70 family)